MFSLLQKIPAIARYIILGLLIVGAFWAFSQVKSCQYDKERKAYQAEREAWAKERATILSRVAERDKLIAEQEPKIAALTAAAEAGKKLSDETQTKIDQISKDAAAEAAMVDQPTDCWIRGDRTCAKLASLKPPIVIDCDLYKRKVCSHP
jgi:uncharacterized protein HemX